MFIRVGLKVLEQGNLAIILPAKTSGLRPLAMNVRKKRKIRFDTAKGYRYGEIKNTTEKHKEEKKS